MKRAIKYIFIIGLVTITCLALNSCFGEIKQVYNTIHPYSNVEFETSEELVHFTAKNGVKFDVPKAYLYAGFQMKGGDQSFNVRAALEEGMPAWTLSEGYKNKDSSKVITISNIYSVSLDQNIPFIGRSYESLEDLVNASFKRNKEYHAKNGHNYDLGKFRGVFHKNLKNRNYRKGVDFDDRPVGHFYLKPIAKTERPYLIDCTANGSPNHILCSASTAFLKDENTIIKYSYHVPLREVEKYLEYDEKVMPLVESFVVDEVQYKKSINE